MFLPGFTRWCNKCNAAPADYKETIDSPYYGVLDLHVCSECYTPPNQLTLF